MSYLHRVVLKNNKNVCQDVTGQTKIIICCHGSHGNYGNTNTGQPTGRLLHNVHTIISGLCCLKTLSQMLVGKYLHSVRKLAKITEICFGFIIGYGHRCQDISDHL